MQKNNQNMHEAKFIQKHFKYFDIMNKGCVDFDQFCRAMEKAGISIGKEDLLVVFSTYDTNGNGELDYKEFSNIICGETTEY